MKYLISFCCSLVFVTATIIVCVEFKIEWHKYAIGVGWFANMIYTHIVKYLTKNETN